MPYNYEIINKFINEADVIWDIETKVKLYFSKDRYNPKIKFNGSKFECFKVNPINFIEERIEEDY